jgi:hypothetical protein
MHLPGINSALPRGLFTFFSMIAPKKEIDLFQGTSRFFSPPAGKIKTGATEVRTEAGPLRMPVGPGIPDSP